MSAPKRYFENDGRLFRTVDYYQELVASLKRIITYSSPIGTPAFHWSFHELYVGPTSIAYLFFRLSLIYPDLQLEGESLLNWAEAYLQPGDHARKHSPHPSHCGIANETLAHLAVSSIVKRDASLAEQVCAFEPVINTPSENGSNEWLYGRAGYLYFLRMCSSNFNLKDHPFTAQLIQRTIDLTVARTMNVPQPWTWHGKHYLGAAHGTIGIICQLVLSKPENASTLQPLLSNLLDTQYASGNFPSSIPTGSDRLVQFCHGGPGFILSLRSLAPFFPELQPNIEQAISKAQADVWKRGLLRKEPSLCHGIAGNSLSFDDQQRFHHFLSYMSTESMEQIGWMDEADTSDESASLYTGEAGRAWLWAIADQNLEKTCIGYNDL